VNAKVYEHLNLRGEGVGKKDKSCSAGGLIMVSKTAYQQGGGAENSVVRGIFNEGFFV
jgi:hypothetical protein